MLKYLVFIIVLFCSLSAKSQNPVGINQPYDFYKWIKIRGALLYPTGCGAPSGTASLNGAPKNNSALYYDSCGHAMYIFDPTDSTWSQAGGTDITNATTTGDTLWNGSALKRLDHDATLVFSTNGTKILMGGDTISHLSTPAKLRDTAAAIRNVITSLTGANGINRSGNTFELGGALNKPTAITSGSSSNGLSISGVSAGSANVVDISSSGTGRALSVRNTGSGIGAFISATSATPLTIQASSSASSALNINSEATSGSAININSLFPNSNAGGINMETGPGTLIHGSAAGNETNILFEVTNFGMRYNRLSTIAGSGGTPVTATFGRGLMGGDVPGVGFNGVIMLDLDSEGSPSRDAGQIEWLWTDPATESFTSDINLKTATNAALATKLSLKGSNGQIVMPFYGDGSLTGTAAYNLAVTAAGEVVEVPVNVGGIYNGSRTADGEYTQNWAGHDLRVDSMDLGRLMSTGLLSGRRVDSRIQLQATNGTYPIYISADRKDISGNDSVSNRFTVERSTNATEIRAIHVGTDKETSLRVQPDQIDLTAYADIATATDYSRILLNESSLLLHSRDSLQISGVEPAATADSALGIVFSENSLAGNPVVYKVVKIPRSASAFLLSDSSTGAATVDIPLSTFAGYDRIEIQFECQPANNNVALQMRFSADGSTFDAGATDYEWGSNVKITGNGTGSQSVTSNPTGGSAECRLTSGLGNNAAYTSRGTITLYEPFNGTYRTTYDGTLMNNSTTGLVIKNDVFGQRQAAQQTNAVRFFLDSGNFSKFKYRVIGYRN